VFGWDEAKVSASAKTVKEVLKPELRQKAKEYVPPVIAGAPAEAADDKGVTVDLGSKKESSGDGVKGKVPKWLKGLGKK